MNRSLRETVMSFIVFLPRSSLRAAKPRMESTLNPVGLIPEGVAPVRHITGVPTRRATTQPNGRCLRLRAGEALARSR